MSIQMIDARKLFLIQTPHATYALAVDEQKRLRHVYWGAQVSRPEDLPDLAGPPDG